MSENDDDALASTPEEIRNIAVAVTHNLLPDKSRKLYNRSYSNLMEWRMKKQACSFSENVLLAYFQEISEKFVSSTLWAEYSMIKSTLNIYEKVDISKYTQLHAFLKRKSEGFKSKKARTFSPSELNSFINEAPDEVYLLIKTAVILGVMGACRRQELHSLLFKDATDLNGALIINIMNTKTKIDRTFTITGKFYHVVKKYIELRPAACKNEHFFVKYYKGKCYSQNIGINSFGNMGKTVASYLKLPNPELYTGHCFRRTSATLLVDAGGDITTLKRHGGWRSTTVAEGYIDNSINNKMKVSRTILNSIEESTRPCRAPTATYIPPNVSPTVVEPTNAPTNQAQCPPSPTFTTINSDHIHFVSQPQNSATGEFNLSQILRQNAPVIITKNQIQNLHIHYHK